MAKYVMVLAVLILLVPPSQGQTYQKPPKAVLDVLNAPLPPSLSVSPSRSKVLISESTNYLSIAEISQPFLGLAGTRFNPKTNRPQVLSYIHSLRIKDLESGRETKILLPDGARISSPEWSPDGRTIAIGNTLEDRYELLLADTETGKVRRVPNLALNGVLGDPYQWTNSRMLLVKTVRSDRGAPPQPPSAPVGPIIQESAGQSGPVRTLQNMLQNPYDEALFEFYGTSQVAVVDTQTLQLKLLGKPGLYSTASASPDGQFVVVTRILKPFSYLHPYPLFPRGIEVWDSSGKLAHSLAKLPLADNVPIGGVPTGPRDVHWSATELSALLWTEALDGGDPKRKVDHRDRLMRFRAPFSGEPVEVGRTQNRIVSIDEIEDTKLALVSELDRNRQWIRTLVFDLDKPGSSPRELWGRNVRDQYNDPGNPLDTTLANGHQAIHQKGGFLFLSGRGATAEGERPFLDRLSLTQLTKERLFRSDADEFEVVVSIVSDDGSKFITRRETPTEPPNYFLVSKDGTSKKLTDFRDPAPELRRVRKQIVQYKRPDGVNLSFTLYLPPDYKPGTKLPTVLHAYPSEFTDPDTASQVGGSAQRFTTLTGYTHLFYVLAGYAVLDNTSMPVVGDPETVNNTYVEQITASAKAAIDKGEELGVVDRTRVGVIGHSYGAFMTANLLAHTDLFRAGVARSGAYNRTLTPFGFQNERRSYWEAPQIYLKMSPFTYADKINEPLLLIHGAADNNAGTFPIQSDRLYQAVRGNGGTVRFVLLPFESHAYSARESIEHTLYEMISWFDRYVKNPAPAQTSGTAGALH